MESTHEKYLVTPIDRTPGLPSSDVANKMVVLKTANVVHIPSSASFLFRYLRCFKQTDSVQTWPSFSGFSHV